VAWASSDRDLHCQFWKLTVKVFRAKQSTMMGRQWMPVLYSSDKKWYRIHTSICCTFCLQDVNVLLRCSYICTVAERAKCAISSQSSCAYGHGGVKRVQLIGRSVYGHGRAVNRSRWHPTGPRRGGSSDERTPSNATATHIYAHAACRGCSSIC